MILIKKIEKKHINTTVKSIYERYKKLVDDQRKQLTNGVSNKKISDMITSILTINSLKVFSLQKNDIVSWCEYVLKRKFVNGIILIKNDKNQTESISRFEVVINKIYNIRRRLFIKEIENENYDFDYCFDNVDESTAEQEAAEIEMWFSKHIEELKKKHIIGMSEFYMAVNSDILYNFKLSVAL